MKDSWAIQKAIFSTLETAEVPTFDAIPDDETVPYCVLGEMTDAPDHTHTDLGYNDTILLHFWDREEDADGSKIGSKRLKQMMGTAARALSFTVIELEGGGTVETSVGESEVFRDESQEPGETWRHGVMRIRVRTLESAP